MKLYKYLSPERTDVLELGLIRYTQPAALNDPFEVRPYISAIASEEEADRVLHEVLPDETKKMYEKQPDQVREILSFQTVQNLATKMLGDQIGNIHSFMDMLTPVIRGVIASKFDELLGILSLTEKADNLLMWSHYSDSHAGFVIGFNADHPYFNERKGAKDEFRHLRKVEYRQDRPQATLVDHSGVEFFLVKSEHWSYEREWRIMRPLPEADRVISAAPHTIHLFKFPPDAVVEIILGSRLGPVPRSNIEKLVKDDARYKHVEVLHAVPDEREFHVRIVDTPT
ncbi:MAG: DUF2971 domain-containing protein [Planctomycetes bacterium]|nr:DUF2971 domain-containing protein [Planctomycetota bacterium]